MPLLEFRCLDCRTNFEDLLKSAAEAVCPKCASARCERLLSAFAVRGPGAASGKRIEDGAASGGCGSCGDPRGPGACRFDG
jgi:putative FmdB family regulatory protein